MSARRRKQGTLKKELKLLVAVVALVLIVCIPSAINAKSYANSQRKEIETLKQQILQEEERKNKIAEDKKYLKSDEYLEKMARDMLGLVKENDIILKPEN